MSTENGEVLGSEEYDGSGSYNITGIPHGEHRLIADNNEFQEYNETIEFPYPGNRNNIQLEELE
jgi:hypothetical protein